jgi:hypothetical protein
MLLKLRPSLTLFLLCCAAGGDSLARAQMAVHINVNQPRPLEVALDKLEKLMGIPINYEDPRYQCAADLQDTTDQVQSAAQKAAHPTFRIIVPTAGALVFDSLMPAVPQPVDALAAVTQLVQQHQAKGNSGRFIVKTVGSVLTVEPGAARNAGCTWTTVSPLMETKIGFASQTRDATDTLTLILNSLTKQVGVKVGLARLPMLSFVKKTATIGANDEPANVVMVRLFEQLSSTPSSVFSYHLFFDPATNSYMADIDVTVPVRAKPLPAGQVQPATGGMLGGAPVKK